MHTPSDWVDELCYYPSMAFMSPSEVAFDDRSAVVIDILHRLIREVHKGNVIKIPLLVIETFNV